MPSNPERDDVVMTLVERALGFPAQERLGYLRTACAGDERLFEETSDRVRREERMGGFLLDPGGPFLEPDQQLAPGQLLGERFEIVRQVGEGGMAWVYEAIDHRLDRRIAIKFPKPVFGGRLLPETVSALKVAHNNVCRVHEIHRAATVAGEVEFLTMEFLEGETLRDRMDREKRLSLGDTEKIARQLCAGLEEAHRKVVVHGDLKPNNVMLTKTADGELRVVITDFGLARPAPGREPPLTGSPLFGAPDYVAPELFQGGSRSVASDLFALGAILCETLGGERPWGEDSESVGREIRVSAKLPPNVPSRWNRVILRCLDPEPAARPRSARAVIEEWEGKWSPVRRWSTAIGALVACLVFGWLIGRLLFTPPPLHGLRLAVLPFEADAASKGLVSGIAQEVTDRLVRASQREGRGMIVIPPGETARNRIMTPQTARAALGATHTLEAGFRLAEGKLLAHAALRDAQTQQIMRSFSAEYALAEVALLPQALLGTVTAGLNLEGLSIPATVQPAAYADYAQGVYYLKDDAHLADRAIPFFERAARLDQRSPLPYAGMVEAQVLMFETSTDRRWLARAEESLQGAKKRNQDAFEVHLAAGRLKSSASQPERALDDLRRAVQLEPSDPDALSALAQDYDQLGLTNEALQAFQQAIDSQPGYYLPHQDLGIFLYNYRGQYPEALVQFRIVTGLAPALAQGHLNLGGAYAKLGRYPESETEMREALKLREDRDTWIALGAVLAYEKRHQESASAYQRAVAMDPASLLALSNLADAYRRSRKSNEALATYKRALQVVDSELTEGDPGSGSGPVRAFAGYIAARLGDRAAAEREIKEALRLSPEKADVRWRAVLTFEVLGKRDDALNVLRKSPKTVVDDLSRQPDLAGLQCDSRFIEMMSKAK